MSGFEPIPPLPALPPLPPLRPRTPSPARKSFHDEAIVVGTTLDNYRSREPTEDGLHVKIIEHSEWFEKVKQPPTPEEIAQRKAEDKKANIIAGVVGVTVLGALGAIVYLDNKYGTRVIPEAVKS
jgi:hypothetical protein